MATSGPYDIGDLVELDADFTDLDDAPADPTVVALSIRRPDGTVTDIIQADLTNPEVGRWVYSVLIDQSGWWWYRIAGTGDVTAAKEKRFRVREREVTGS